MFTLFIDLSRFANVESFEGNYFVVISRPNKYKKIDLAIRVCCNLKIPLKVIGADFNSLPSSINSYQNIEVLGNVSEETVRRVLAGAKGLIVTAEEDFGLTSLEAQALGKPVIAFGKGGSLETIIEGKTGIFFETQEEHFLEEAIKRLDTIKINPQECKDNASQFSKEKFVRQFRQTVASLLYT